MHILRLQKLAENAQDDLRNAEAAVSSFKEELDAFREVSLCFGVWTQA